MRALIFIGFLLNACAGYGPFADEAAEEVQPAAPMASAPTTPVPVPASTVAPASDLELRIAKLWARVDDLENQQIRQKERMKLLEKGLMLGIIPEELKTDKPVQPPQKPEPEDPPASVQATTPPPLASGEKSKDLAEYQRLLRAAQEKFNAASYGQAIVQYNEIGEKFDDSLTEGSHHYWTGLSWFYLKEMQLAEQSFLKLIDRYSHNSWVPYARFYMAKIDLNRGLSGRARDQFKMLIDEYPNQDLGEMARMEIDRMREKL
ncbi:tetratricopeptide repeat protein [Oligoflexus tunisiensis]|uniref:tetratricopeptide repeat protein n=1 Tax=Oligoflexus tunisiensis TaxID=708132 RepID=UPI00159F310B|nr:tetratricopeptide repeat protein [Oligoflexus tunisiensis]